MKGLTVQHVLAARRELARRSLEAYCGMIEIPGAPVEEDIDSADIRYKPIRPVLAAHHRLLISKLEAVERGDIRRLMVFMPPGSAKSSYASVVFPTWFMGRHRRRNVIVATYASDLARKIGRRARSILKQPVYEEIFGTSLSADTAAADEWALTNENEFMGGGILSGITGNRADLIIIDDPIKGRQQADSEVTRETTKAAYDDDLKTRLKPGGRIVLIQTRWHASDLAGSLLPEDYAGESGPIQCRDGETWEVISIAAEAVVGDPLGRKPGEMLWPEWFDDAHWNSFRANPRTWSALYQQNPAPDEGTYFKKEWFNRYTVKPKGLHVYMSSDHAPGGTEESDYNCLCVWGVDAQGQLWLLDSFRKQCKLDAMAGVDTDENGDLKLALEGALPLIKRWRPHCWFPEDDNNWKSAEPFIRAAMRKTKVICRIETISTSGGDKPTKALAFQAKALMGQVYIPEGHKADEILTEYVRFPAGKHDDAVDAAATIGRALDMAHPAILKTAPQAATDPSDRYTRARPSSGSDNDWLVA